MVTAENEVNSCGLKVFFGGAAVVSFIAALVEGISGHQNTALLLASRYSPMLKEMGLVNVATALGLAILSYVFCAQIGRVQREKSLVKRIFQWFEHTVTAEFCVDLLIKFAFLAVIIGGNAPDYLAAVLLLFTGHYLVRGYFASIPKELARGMGIAYSAIGMILAITISPYLLMPLVGFATAASAEYYYRQTARN